MVGNDGIFSRTILACLGITAGSGFVTSELRLLLLDLVEAISHRSGDDTGVGLKLYVDDLTIAVSGPREVVAHNVAKISEFATFMLEKVIKLKVSEKKTVVVASSVGIAVAASRFAHSKKLRAARAAKLFGTATSGGSRRSASLLKTRTDKFRKNAARIQRLRKHGVNTAVRTRYHRYQRAPNLT